MYEHSSPTAVASHAIKSPPRSILVVDDDVAFRLRLVKALGARGVEAQAPARRPKR